MRLFIIDENTEAELCIYGIDGNDHTEKFFVTHFSDKGVKILSEEEKKKYNTTADYAIKNICYAALAGIIEDIQRTIDLIADDYEKSGCNVGETYSFDSGCYVV
ncbi:MAG: hypothetical protein NC253_00740 [Ruminococcus sp.]|nr:hypothetical protein [Ruminococcus sp.]MCM1381062.1 hypothetical protein [Muribaculaceae bacterium]MCM1478573.1 hypothetical protein [Muribaculaceae bacterium]